MHLKSLATHKAQTHSIMTVFIALISFPWSAFIKYTCILTVTCWAGFFFYDYFIIGSKTKEDIYDNPINKKTNELDSREQVLTDKVEFDAILK